MSELNLNLINIKSGNKFSTRKSDRTRTAILNGALEFLWMRPFREMTVAELMAITGISRSAFYQYFKDLHEPMETLLQGALDALLEATDPWINCTAHASGLLEQSLSQLVDVCYEIGPIFRAVAEASTNDERLEAVWADFQKQFDDAVCERIEAHQKAGFISEFNAWPVAVALNRLNSSMLIDAFGRHPRNNPEPVKEAIIRIWVSTLYQ